MFRLLLILTVLTGAACDDAVPTAPSATPAPNQESAPPRSVVSVTVQGPTLITGRGTSGQLTATATYSDNTTADITTAAGWTSSNPVVGSVNTAGMFTANGFGVADIAASAGGARGTISITVEELPGGPGTPAIELTTVPPYGSTTGRLAGRILHVAPERHHVAVYIRVASGWWTKPYWATPATIPKSDGTWTCNIVTGGRDELATEIRAFVLPASVAPPLASGQASLPAGLTESALASVTARR